MLYFEKTQKSFRIKDKNLSEFDFGPFKNIRIKGKRQDKNEDIKINNLKSREDRIGKYKNIFFIKQENLINTVGINDNKNFFEGLILYRIKNIKFINEDKLNLIRNYKFKYNKVEILPNIQFFYVNNLNIYLLPILNGLFGKYLYSFKYIISDEIKFNLPFEFEIENIDTLYNKTTELVNNLKKIKENKTLIGKTTKSKLIKALQEIISNYIKLLTNFYIIIINSLRTKYNLEKLQNLPDLVEEYKAHGKLLENNINLNIERYRFIYQRLITYFEQYYQLLISEFNSILEN